MYDWTLLRKNSEELVKKTFDIQRATPQKNDFILQIRSDMKYLNLTFSDDDISCMRKQALRSAIDERIKIESIRYLSSLRKQHSKSKPLSLSDEMQLYLKSPVFSCKQQILLFNLRVRAFDVKSNYRSKFEGNMGCRYCLTGLEENYSHLLVCRTLINEEKLKQNAIKVNEHFLYGSIEQQKQVVLVFECIARKIEILKTSNHISET